MKFDEKLASLMEGFKPRQLLMMAGGIGLLTFVFLYLGLSNIAGNNEPPPPPPPQQTVKTTKIVQAKTDIKAREQIKDSMLQLVEVPVSMVPEGALTETKGLIGRPTRFPIMAGDYITEKKLFSETKNVGFSGSIPPNYRAVSIAVSNVTGVAGFLKPGDYVDVMLVSEKIDNSKISGEIILQNVLLLGVNNTADRPNENPNSDQDKGNSGKGKNNKSNTQNNKAGISSATLAVRPEDELRLAVAAHAGQLYLSLRSYEQDRKQLSDTKYDISKGREKDKNEKASVSTLENPLPAPSIPTQPPLTKNTAQQEAALSMET